MSAPHADYAARVVPGEEACAADQLLTLHDAARARPDGTYLERGTDLGQAAKVILNALAGHVGLPVSRDVEDRSHAASEPNWRFVRSNIIEIDTICEAAPRLRNGIDLIYVNSPHTTAPVHAGLTGWFPHMRPGGLILIDDVDPPPYMRRHRKGSVKKEQSNRSIAPLAEAIFCNSLNALRFGLKLVLTGVAILTKTAPLGTKLAVSAPCPHRAWTGNWHIWTMPCADMCLTRTSVRPSPC